MNLLGNCSPAVRYLSNGTERLGSLIPQSESIAVIDLCDLSPSWPRFSRSAICRFTLSINTTNFFDS